MAADMRGTDWTSDELALVVADYFAMLYAELQRTTYSKAGHRRALMQFISRSEGSIEFKHQNISAVLQELGLPWISGYKPRFNYQAALLDAVEAHLDSQALVLADAQPQPTLEIDPDAIEVPPPVILAPPEVTPQLRSLIRKFDPAARDARNRKLGKAGEEFVLGLERRRLIKLGQERLADQVRWVSEVEGDGAGYDILSFSPKGEQRMLEVKTTCGTERTPFYLTRNELRLSDERPEEFRLVRVHQFVNDPKLFVLAPPLTRHVMLEPTVYRAGWG